MNKATRFALAATCLFLNGTEPANAQSPAPTKNVFVDVNFGLQPQSQSLTVSSTPLVYGETAFIDSTQAVDGSPFLDLAAGYRIWSDLSIAIGVTTTFNKGSTASVSASIPSPIFFDRRVVTTTTLPDLEHKERSAHVMAVWTSPVTDKIDASIMAGPSYVKVFQGLVRNVTVAPGTQTPTATAETQTATAVGFNVGGDVTFLVTPRIGVGGMFRYVKATVDLESVPGMEVGRIQFGGGLRVRF